MLKSVFDGVMERRARELVGRVHAWLPVEGPVLDLGSGTGHAAALLEREHGVDVVTADVSDMRVVGPRPVLVGDDGELPFAARTFPAVLLLFMLAYPERPVGVLVEAARVARGPVILVQTVYRGRAGRAWHRGREFVWTVAAFHISKLIGYVPADASFSMRTRRFYTAPALERDVAAAGLRIEARREIPVLPGRALVVIAWKLEADD